MRFVTHGTRIDRAGCYMLPSVTCYNRQQARDSRVIHRHSTIGAQRPGVSADVEGNVGRIVGRDDVLALGLAQVVKIPIVLGTCKMNGMLKSASA